MKEKIYNILEVDNDNESKLDEFYSYFMILMIVISIIPLFTRGRNKLFYLMEDISLVVFLIDYLLRWYCADVKIKKGWKSFIIYPFTFFALVDFLSIVPAFSNVNNGFKALKIMRVVKCFKIFKTLRYSKSFMLMIKVFEKEKNSLITVFMTAIGYIAVTALIMFNAENSFKSYFDAVYWATTALTTVGYGDIYPVSELGKIVSMISSFIGIAIVAIPSGIITAGYIEEVKTR